MEYRHLGGSGFKVPVFTLGTGTFGGRGHAMFDAIVVGARCAGSPHLQSASPAVQNSLPFESVA